MTIRRGGPEDGERIELGGIHLRIREDGSGTAGRLGLVEVTLDPGETGPPQHLHHEHDETFLVLSGTVRFISWAERVDERCGALVIAPVGEPHTFANPDPDEPAVLRGTVSPTRYIDYFRELAAAIQMGNELGPAEIIAIMSRYATEPY